MSNKATVAFIVVYGIIMHCSVCCSQTGVKYPGLRIEDEAYDEKGNSLPDYITDGNGIRIPSSMIDDANTLYYPPEKRHADGILNKALRRVLGQIRTRTVVQSLIHSKRFGGSSVETDTEPLSKRHSDGIFTDSYSRYRKQMAVKKYLAAVLGKSHEDINIAQIIDDIDTDALLGLLEGDWDSDLGELLQQIPLSAI